MGAAASKIPSTASSTSTNASKTVRKVIKTSLRREDLMQRPQYREIKKPALVEMDNKVLHQVERFDETVEKVEYLETDMKAFKATAAGQRKSSDGPVQMPIDKTRASNSETLVDDIPGIFTDRQFRQLLRLYREDPNEWTTEKLATYFHTKPSIIQDIVIHCCPPRILPPPSAVTNMDGRDEASRDIATSSHHSSRSRKESRRSSMALTDVVNNLPPEAFVTQEVKPPTQDRIQELHTAQNTGWRYRVRYALNHPQSSRRGLIYHYTILTAIVGNFIPMMLETMDGPANGGSDPMHPFLPSAKTFTQWEILFTALFGCDLFLKILVTTRHRKFWTRAITWIDIFSISFLPGSYLMEYGFQWSIEKRKRIESYLKLLRLFRIVRITYMLRNVDGIKILKATTLECLPPLRITFFFLITIVMMFATMLYYAEPCYDKSVCPFTDIFNAGYFVMVSVTTVGYGDQVPGLDNLASVVVSTVVMMFGTLYLAMPLAIIGIKYELMWLRFEVHTSKSTSSGVTRGTRNSVSKQRIGPLPSEMLSLRIHRTYLQYLNLTREMNQLHDMIVQYVHIPGEEILSGYHNRLHNETLEKLHHSCKHVIQLYHKFMTDMSQFQPKIEAASSGSDPDRHHHRSRASSLTSFASVALTRAKNMFQNNETAQSQVIFDKRNGNPQVQNRVSFRRRLRRILEHPELTSSGIYVNGFFYLMVFCSVLMFYAETAPELQEWGLTSPLCREAISAYCSLQSRTFESDKGCYVWKSPTNPTADKLDFHCKVDSDIHDGDSTCYGNGWNYGSPTTTYNCTLMFAEPGRVCSLRQCQSGHEPIINMTDRWLYFEAFFAAVFTIEFLLRIFATRRRAVFLRSLGTWLSIGAIIPFYVEIFVCLIQTSNPSFAITSTFPTFLSVLPILKTLRVLKMGKHFKSVAVLSKTAALTYQRLLIPLFFLFLGCVAAGAMFYEIERGTQCLAHMPCLWWGRDIMTRSIASPFPPEKRIQIQIDRLTILTDMWRSTWLSVATFTSVGYGDMKPRTPFGRLLDIIVTIFGSIYTAMPLSLIGGQFYFCYEQYVKQREGEEGSGIGMGAQRLPVRPKRITMLQASSLLHLEDIELLKKCGVVVLLLDEMMQNMYKINQLSPHPATLELPHHTTHADIVRTHHPKEFHPNKYHHDSNGRRNSTLASWRRVSGGTIATMFGRSPNRIVPTAIRVGKNESEEADKMKQLLESRNLIRTASTHISTIFLQLTRIMEKVVVPDQENISQKSMSEDKLQDFDR